MRAFATGNNFLRNHPTHNFLINFFPDDRQPVLEDKGPKPTPRSATKRPPGGGPDGGPGSKKRTARSTDPTEIRHVYNVRQLALELAVTDKQTIFTFDIHDNSYCNIDLYKFTEHHKIFQTTYSLFYMLMKGYFTSSFYQHEIGELNVAMQTFLLKLNDSGQSNEKKMGCMDSIMAVIQNEMKANIWWYWYPDYSLKEVIKMTNFQIQILSL